VFISRSEGADLGDPPCAGDNSGSDAGGRKGIVRVVSGAGARNTRKVLKRRSIFVTGVLLALVSLSGCARQRQQTAAPIYAPPPTGTYQQQAYQVGDTPAANYAYSDVYVQDQYFADPFEQQPAEMIGYETMSTGEQVVVVTYVHTYPEAIETFPRVYWAGRWYYNVHGSFVFWDPYWSVWSYYWGPPAPLVVCWNYHYPWVAYSWGVGYYGPGWYWGGVGYYGYHAYGRPPDYWRPSHSPNGDPGGPTGGRPSTPPNNGGGGGTTGVEASGNRDVTAGGTQPGRAPTQPTVAAGGTNVQAPAQPGRAGAAGTNVDAGRTPVASRIEPSKPPRAPVASTRAPVASTTANPPRARVPNNVVIHSSSPTATRPTYSPPVARRAPANTPTSRSVGTNPHPNPSRATPSRSNGAGPVVSSPSYRTSSPAPSRSSSPSYSPSRSSSPSYSPSRSSSPSYSPSRSSSPSYSPSRSHSPSRSSGPSYSPSRSSGPSYSPSRSSGPSFSPSRSGGGGGGGGGFRGGGGGGGHHGGGGPSRAR
jgi:hypothetical protein